MKNIEFLPITAFLKVCQMLFIFMSCILIVSIPQDKYLVKNLSTGALPKTLLASLILCQIVGSPKIKSKILFDILLLKC